MREYQARSLRKFLKRQYRRGSRSMAILPFCIAPYKSLIETGEKPTWSHGLRAANILPFVKIA
jgi:hypothetical protein